MITLKRLQANNLKGLRSIDIIFPEQGSLLIEGQNEAGKSTLFEAVYVGLYGKPLVGHQEDLIQYHQPKATVELVVSVGTQTLSISRVFERGKPQHAAMSIEQPGTQTEVINRVRTVDDRILKELGNLDGESLRNSCFVEQKELGRIEALRRADRELAIQKLLGLERLTQLIDEFKYHREQERELALAEKRLELAQLQEKARTIAEQENIQAMRLDAIKVASHLESLSSLAIQQENVEKRLSELASLLEEVQVRLDRCTDLKKQLACGDQAAQSLKDIAYARHQLNQIKDALAHLEQIEQVDLPLAQAALEEVTRASEAVAQVNRARTELQLAEENVKHETLRFTLADNALKAWIRLKSVESVLHDYSELQEGLLVNRRVAEAALVAGQSRARVALLISLVLSILAVAALSAWFIWFPAILLFVVLGLATIVSWVWYGRMRKQMQPPSREVESLKIQLQQLDMRRQAAIQTGGDPIALQDHERQLQEAGIEVPADLAAAQELATDFLQALDDTRENQGLERTRERKENVTPYKIGGPLGQLSQATSHARQVQIACQQQQERVQHRLQQANLSSESEVEPERGRREARLSIYKEELATRPSQTEKQATQTNDFVQKVQTTAALIDNLLTEAQILSVAALPVFQQKARDDDSTFAFETEWSVMLERIKLALQNAVKGLDEPGAKRTRDVALEEQGSLKQQASHIRDEIKKHQQEIPSLFARHNLRTPSDATREAVMIAWPLVAQVAPEEEKTMSEQLEETSRELYATSKRANELATELSLSTIAASIEECQQEVDRLREERAICQRAQKLLRETHDRIARRVLPITERNMQPLLQQLTSGRYRDVRLTPESVDGQSGELDYRIRVWDPAARRFVAKNIFSGGTRDQCSLALRLAFALATLPQELGVAPGFIFLDEPLSAFDAQRAQALVDLLTTGTIAQQFSQVVLISHNHAFSREAFRYHVRMESGQIVESDLPTIEE
jgi:exonuclease SbcC